MSKNAQKIWQLVIARLVEKGLPPTPENYAETYYELAPEEAGEAASRIASAAAANPHLIDAVRRIVDAIGTQVGDLAEDLGERNAIIREAMESLQTSRERAQITALLTRIVSTASAMQQAVEDSRQELLATRREIESLRDEVRANQTALSESHELLIHDEMTGAFNRRGMDIILSREMAKVKRSQTKIAFAMVDLDHFKHLNDQFGHAAGDTALMHFTGVARSVLREVDSLIRYGGEEFLIVLPETDLAGAQFAIDRLKVVLSKNPVLFEGRRIPISFSGGLALLAMSETAHAAIARADLALYAAKQAGRNCIKIAVSP